MKTYLKHEWVHLEGHFDPVKVAFYKEAEAAIEKARVEGAMLALLKYMPLGNADTSIYWAAATEVATKYKDPSGTVE